MSNKHGIYSSKSESIEGREVEKLKLLYRNTGNPEKDKSSRVSSDEETTSSSLIPIPDTLSQIRNELKTTFLEGGEPSEPESFGDFGVLEESKGKISTSLDELRRKYTLKNETSVVLKMNSANLMLDDILKSSHLKVESEEGVHPHFDREEDFKMKTIYETETSSTVSTVKHSTHVPLLPNVLYSTTPVLCGHHYSSSCTRHDRNIQPVCNCSSSLEKAPPVSIENQKKKSLIEKLQGLQLRYKLNSVYKVMQKNNPFVKDKKHIVNTQNQGIPGITRVEDPAVTEDPANCKCDSTHFANQCNKKMVFDLIESSDVSISDSKSQIRGERHFTYPMEINYTDFFGRGCKCSELIPRFVHPDCTCNHVDQSCEKVGKAVGYSSPSPPKKTNEYVQTEDVTPLNFHVRSQLGSSLAPQKENNNERENNITPFTINRKDSKKSSKESKSIERTDIYYFDHGNSAYYQTTDNHPVRYTECLVERTDEYATKFWAEIFGTIGIGVSFLTSFILQLNRFFFTIIIRTLTVGLLQIFTDYFFKPLLAIIFNGVIQPCLILAYNIATSLRDLCLPISQIFGFFAKEVTNIFKSCRLIEVNNGKCRQSSCYCGNKV